MQPTIKNQSENTLNNNQVPKNYAGQPIGSWVMFVLQIIGFIGFMMVLSLLVLYCTNELGLPDHDAYGISGAFNALAFAMSVPASYIAERYLGFRFASFLSMVLATIGLFIMMIKSKAALLIGLGTFTFGNSLMLPCFFVLLGRLYAKNDAVREWGFTLSYIGMNIGGFMAATASGYVSSYLGYDVAFLIGAVTTVIMIPIFFAARHLFDEKFAQHHITITTNKRNIGLGLIVLTTLATIALVYFYSICNSLLLFLGVICVIYMVQLALKAKSAQEKRNLFIFAILIVISVMFWTLYSLAPSALTIFTERNIDRNVLGHIIPAADFSSLNNFFIFTVGPFLSLLWIKMQKKGYPMSTPAKIASGVLLMGIGYLVLVAGIGFSSKTTGLMGVSWLVLSYFFQTVGELMVGPVNYAMVGEFVPAKLEGTMMGISQLSTGIGGALSVYFADYTSSGENIINPLLTNATYSHAFMMFGSLTVIVSLVAFAIAFMLKKKKSTVSKAATPA